MFAELIRLAPAERQKALYRIVDTFTAAGANAAYAKARPRRGAGAAAGFGPQPRAGRRPGARRRGHVFTSRYIHLGHKPRRRDDSDARPRRRAKAGGRADAARRPFRRRRALELGLVNRVVPADALAAEAAGLVARLAAGHRRYGRTKALLQATLAMLSTRSCGARPRALRLPATADFAEGCGLS